MSSFYIENFGCRATQADGAALERQFQDLGLARAANSAQAEVVVLNTCTVTEEADRDARAAIRRVLRQNPEAKIVVTGCYAQRAPQEIAALPGVSLVVGNSHKHQLAHLVLARNSSESPGYVIPNRAEGAVRNPLLSDVALACENNALSAQSNLIPITALTGNRQPVTADSIFVSDIFAHTELLAAPVFDAANARTRPNLKVQDGCDNRCSFCVIPYVRGQSRSLPIDRILDEIHALVDAGYREVVISGINLGRWGRDLAFAPHSAFGMPSEPTTNDRRPNSDDPRLESLIRAILSHTSVEKLRISSVEPMDWSNKLISLLASSPRIAKHAHVPMQSGSDAVLRRMHRKYRPWHYREKIEKIRAAMPTAAIGADVMVGFPGETDAEFEATRRMIEELPFTYLHVFTYSPRPGTPAAARRNQVPAHVARERNRILRDLAAEKKRAFMRSLVGQTLDAITLNSSATASSVRRGEGTPARVALIASSFTEGLTDNYLKVRLEGTHDANRWLRVRVEGISGSALTAQVAEPAQLTCV